MVKEVRRRYRQWWRLLRGDGDGGCSTAVRGVKQRSWRWWRVSSDNDFRCLAMVEGKVVVVMVDDIEQLWYVGLGCILIV